jgi:hypothetical protein
MKKITIELIAENGKFLDNTEISYLFRQPKLIIIDNKYFVQQFEGGKKYQQTTPQVYKEAPTRTQTN